MKIIYTIILAIIPGVAFAGGYGGFNKVQKNVVVEQKVVEFDADLYYGFNAYAVVDELNEKRKGKLESKDELIQKLLEQNKELIDVLLKINGKLGDGEPVSPGIPNDPENPTTPDEPDSSDIGSVELMLVNKCAGCHSDGKHKYFENDSLAENLKNPKTVDDFMTKAKIYERVHGGSLIKEQNLAIMPKGDKPLTTEEVTDVWLWLKGIKD